MTRRASNTGSDSEDRSETIRVRAVAVALALAIALLAGPTAPAGAEPNAPVKPWVVAAGASKSKTKHKTGGFLMNRWSPWRSAPENSPVDIAIRAARAQLGKPYRWAGTGPSGFDCSGLVRFVWARAGIGLPRSSRAQYASVTRVSLEDLRPGDLVFSGWRSVSHVGLYIGKGKMIHSPHSGRRVEVAPLRSNLVGAGRPKS